MIHSYQTCPNAKDMYPIESWIHEMSFPLVCLSQVYTVSDMAFSAVCGTAKIARENWLTNLFFHIHLSPTLS